MKQWKLRKLTIFGRFTIIKSLIPKIKHLILLLPNESKYFLENFEREVYLYLQGRKLHKVKKKKNYIKDSRSGGLNLVDYYDWL